MTKYIDIEQATETFKKVLPITPRSCSKTNIYVRWILALSEAWNNIPAADVQPVVRCKDCKHRRTEYRMPYCELDTGDPYELGRNAEDDNWFCADGARMDGREDGS